MEAEKLTPKKPPLADALASKVDLYDLVPEMRQTTCYYCKKHISLQIWKNISTKYYFIKGIPETKFDPNVMEQVPLHDRISIPSGTL